MNRTVRLLVAASVLSWSAPFARAEEAAKNANLDAAMKKFEEGKFAEALEAANQVGAEDPSRAKARYLAGEIDLALGDPGAAEAAFREALAKKQESAPILAGLGRALLEQKKSEEAIEPLTKAGTVDPASPRYKAWLGLALSRTGKGEDGRKALVAAMKTGAADPEVARAAVEERLEAQDADGAGKAAAAFAKARKDHPMGPFLVALVLDRAGKFDEAIAGYEKVLVLDPGYIDAHKNLAILCIAQNPVYTNPKRTKKAMEHFKAYEQAGGRDQALIQTFRTIEGFVGGGAGTGDGK